VFSLVIIPTLQVSLFAPGRTCGCESALRCPGALSLLLVGTHILCLWKSNLSDESQGHALALIPIPSRGLRSPLGPTRRYYSRVYSRSLPLLLRMFVAQKRSEAKDKSQVHGCSLVIILIMRTSIANTSATYTLSGPSRPASWCACCRLRTQSSSYKSQAHAISLATVWSELFNSSLALFHEQRHSRKLIAEDQKGNAAHQWAASIPSANQRYLSMVVPARPNRARCC
jgi:hypothetical protein